MLPKKRPQTHPGEKLLKEFLQPMGIMQAAFARHLSWTWARLNEIANSRRSITANSVLSLGEALGTGPEFWMNLQRDWDLWHEICRHKRVAALKKAS